MLLGFFTPTVEIPVLVLSTIPVLWFVGGFLSGIIFVAIYQQR